MSYKKPAILVIYTGGTIGMILDSASGILHPFDFGHLKDRIPEIKKFNYNIDTLSFDPVIDSSNIDPGVWVRISNIIFENYHEYDGFVILHGTDTMAYTSSALSFMLENLSKPVILTGSQLPLGMIRTDGKENLITAIEIAATKNQDRNPVVPEVAIYFENQLFRGNRTHKYNADNFEAFRSVNYPALAKAGVNIKYNQQAIKKIACEDFNIFTKMNRNIATLKLFPGITKQCVKAILSIDDLQGVVMETFGSGNAPTEKWFLNEIKEAIMRGLIILNVTQCKGGTVKMDQYETGMGLKSAGVLNGYDITYEAAVTKMMYLFGHNYNYSQVKENLEKSLRGEMSV